MPGLFVAWASHGVAATHDRLQAGGELDEEEVAVVVAEGVVDLLEAVEIPEQDLASCEPSCSA